MKNLLKKLLVWLGFLDEEELDSIEDIYDYCGVFDQIGPYIVLRRSVLAQMPLWWQRKFVGVLNEADEFLLDLPKVEYKVTAIHPDIRKFMKDPMAEYKRPVLSDVPNVSVEKV